MTMLMHEAEHLVKPLDPVLREPLPEGLKFLYSGQQGNTHVDLIQSLKGTPNNGGLGLMHHRHGRGWAPSADSSYLDFGDPGLSVRPAELSVVAFGEFGNATWADVMAYSDAAGNSQFAFHAEQWPGTGVVGCNLDGTDYNSTLSTPSGFGYLAMSMDADNLYFNVNGEENTVAHTGWGGGTTWDTFAIGAEARNGAWTDGLGVGDGIYFLAYYEECLTYELLEHIRRHTYHHYFKPDLNFIFVPSVVGPTIISRTLSSSVNIYDSQTRVTDALRVLSEQLSITDQKLGFLVLSRLLTDSIVADDSIARYIEYVRHLQDSFDIDDSIIRTLVSVGLLNRVLQDSVNLNDSLKSYKEYLKLLTENFDVIDAIDRYLLIERSLSDNIDISDSLIRSVGVVVTRILQDSIAVVDSSVDYLELSRGLLSAISITDSLFRETQLLRLLQDNTVISDEIVRTIVSNFVERILRDSISISDEIIRTILRSEHAQKIIMELVKRDVDFELKLRNILYELGEL